MGGKCCKDLTDDETCFFVKNKTMYRRVSEENRNQEINVMFNNQYNDLILDFSKAKINVNIPLAAKDDIKTNANERQSNNKSGSTFNFTANLEKLIPKEQKSQESVKQITPKSVIKEESKYESEIENEEKKESERSVSSPSNSASNSDSEFDINQCSIPKIRVSNYDEMKESKVSLKKINFDPK